MAIYCIHDHDPELKKRGAFEIQKSEIRQYNQQGYGIFHTANEFNGRRKAENLVKINYWLADIDEGDKFNEQIDRIMSLPLIPTILIETKKGFHCYWKAENATLENYKEIEKGLIQRLKADKACTDVCRLLRYPGTYHMKDPQNPFKVELIMNNKKSYSEEKMLCAYQLPKPKLKPLKYNGEKKDFLDESKWERFFNVSQVGEGNRNSTLVRYTFWMKDQQLNNSQIEYIINGLNQKIAKPLSQQEVDQLLRTKGVY